MDREVGRVCTLQTLSLLSTNIAFQGEIIFSTKFSKEVIIGKHTKTSVFFSIRPEGTLFPLIYLRDREEF